MPPRKRNFAVAPNRDATKRRGSPELKKRKAISGKRSSAKSVLIRKEMIIIDGQQRISAVRSYLKSLRALPAHRRRIIDLASLIAKKGRV